MGEAILQAPLEMFKQNDLVAYGVEILYQLPFRPLRLGFSSSGLANTRRSLPLGTEGRGSLHLGADYHLGGWLLDIAGSRGFAGNSPHFQVEGGISRLLHR